ncbi:hypothetical protein [Pandoraea sp.]|uniref:hypothetical protein n=1 Tax=Pandoraea sp. TaxID=1883445 RepID=UPI0035AEB74D
MQGTIAQIVALVLEGNAVLRDVDSPGMGMEHSANTFCEFVHFVDLDKTPTGWSERQIAADPTAWFRYLKEHGFIELRMSHGPSNDPNVDGVTVTDRMLVGFVGGGGVWSVQANKPNSSDYWAARWVVGDQQSADRRIWRVTYGRVAGNRPPSEIEQVDLQSLRDQFCDVLMRVEAFATQKGLDGFAACFARGLEDLSAESPIHGFHKEFANSSLISRDAIQLLSAAQSSWVFGGMGSWNDLGFDGEDQATYESLSEALYRISNRAIVAATNTSAMGSICRAASTRNSVGPMKRPWWKIFG